MDDGINTNSVIRTWLPIITRCPLSVIPDFIYVELHCQGFVELYAARKKIRKLVSGKRMFMEDIAKMVLREMPETSVEMVTVRLMFGVHRVTAYREE